MKSLLFTLIALVAMAATALAGTVVLSWDPNPAEDNVRQYKVYYGNYSGSSVSFTSTGTLPVAAPATTATISGLSTTQKWFFRVTAVNDVMESTYSNFVSVAFIRTPAAVKFQRVEVR